MPKRLKGVPNLPFPPIVAAMYGAVTGVLIHQTPQWLFEHGVDLSGVARFIPAAAPPLGENARLLAAGGGAVAAFLLLWPVLSMAQARVRKMRKKPVVVQRSRGIVVAESLDPPVEFEAPLPGMDAEIRAPIFAGNDLGAPLMSQAALDAGDELMLEEPLDAPDKASPMHEPMAASAYAPVVSGPEETGFAISGFAAPADAPFAREPEPVQPQWQIPEHQDYPTPPIQPPLMADTQFRIAGLPEPEETVAPALAVPVFDPVALADPAEAAIEAPAMPVESINLGFGALAAAAEPRDTIDPFASSQGWNLPSLAADAEPEAKVAEPVAAEPRISPTLSPGFNPLAIDLGDNGGDPVAAPSFSAPEPAEPATPAAFVPAPGEIDPFAISFDSSPKVAPAASIPVSPVQHAPEPRSSAQDDSVQGLMARLNQAMGSRLRPAGQPQGSEPSIGLGSLRAI